MKIDLNLYQHVHPEVLKRFSYKPELSLIICKIASSQWLRECDLSHLINGCLFMMKSIEKSIQKFMEFEEKHKQELEDIEYFEISYLGAAIQTCHEFYDNYANTYEESQKELQKLVTDKEVLISYDQFCKDDGLILPVVIDLIQELVNDKLISVKQDSKGFWYKILDHDMWLQAYLHFENDYLTDLKNTLKSFGVEEEEEPKPPKPVLSDKIEEGDFFDIDAFFSRIPD